MGIALNWIAQGLLVASATGFALWLLPAGRARARVRVWWTVVASVMALPLVPLVWSALEPARSAATTAAAAAAVQEPLVVVPQQVWTATSLALALWMAWMAVQGVRLALDLHALAGVRRRCLPAPPVVEGRLRPSTRARLARSGARLAVSSEVRAAAVLGAGRPVIALHPALLQHLTDTELDQVVVHEWAHVARRDALETLLQRGVHAAVGWHPAIWIAMARLRIEREMACDEVVVDATGSAKAYAVCLTRVAGLAKDVGGARLAVAMSSAPGLTRRIVRLLARRSAPAIAPQWMLVPAAMAVAVALAGGRLQLFGLPLALVESRVLAFQPQPAPRVTAGRPAAPPARTETGQDAGRPVPRVEETDSVEAPRVPADMPHQTTAEGSSEAAGGGALAAEMLPAAPLLAAAPPLASPGTAASAAGETDASVGAQARDAWVAAAQAGESIGRESRRGAVATAGFFTRVSRQIAGAF